MDERILKWLYDIKLAVEEIEQYFENTDKNFFEYQKNNAQTSCGERFRNNWRSC